MGFLVELLGDKQPPAEQAKDSAGLKGELANFMTFPQHLVILQNSMTFPVLENGIYKFHDFSRSSVTVETQS